LARNFRELLVWQKAAALSVEVYRVTRLWPKDELYGLTSQVRRASISVVSNIAEGEGRQSPKEFCRFLQIAHGSLREMEAQLFVARELGYLELGSFDLLDNACVEVGRMLNGLMRSLRSRQED
jgi:four helix bundle protein